MIQFAIYKSLLTTFLISFFLASVLIPICRWCAFKFKIVDAPDGKLKIHEKTTPYLGGVAIYVAILITLLFRFNFDLDVSVLFLTVTLLMFLGLIDDIYVIKPYLKFLGQTLSILLLLVSNFYFVNFFFNKYLTIPLKLFWNLSIINAFNLIDVMDGLCSSVAIIPAISFLIISLIFNQVDIAILLVAFLGALISFLVYNFPPAKIYLGDSGSMFIGGFLSLIPFLIKWPSIPIALISSLSLLLVPVLELVSLILIRSYKGIPFYLGSPDHFSIYLRRKGWSKKRVLLYVAFINILVSLIIILNILNYLSLGLIMLLLSVITSFWFIVLLF